MNLPLKDGDVFETLRGGVETVIGEIKPKHDVKGGVCWTLQGNWYRRVDGVQVSVTTSQKVRPLPEVYKSHRTARYS